MRRRDGGSGVSERSPREDVLWRWFQCWYVGSHEEKRRRRDSGKGKGGGQRL